MKLDDRPQQGDKIGVDWHGARVSVSLTLRVPLFVLDANGLPLVGISAGNGVWGRLHEAVLHRLDDAGLIDVTRVALDTAHVRAKKGALDQIRNRRRAVDLDIPKQGAVGARRIH